MGKIFQKNYESANDCIEIAREDVDALLRSERWAPLSEQIEDQTGVQNEGANAITERLYERPVVEVKTIDVERLVAITSEDIIERFLRVEPRRIVAEEGEVQQEIVTEADFDDEDDVVSEELAEVYLAQGLKDMAKETYRKLSLLNPEKSIYFAEIISKIDRNN